MRKKTLRTRKQIDRYYAEQRRMAKELYKIDNDGSVKGFFKSDLNKKVNRNKRQTLRRKERREFNKEIKEVKKEKDGFKNIIPIDDKGQPFFDVLSSGNQADKLAVDQFKLNSDIYGNNFFSVIDDTRTGGDVTTHSTLYSHEVAVRNLYRRTSRYQSKYNTGSSGPIITTIIGDYNGQTALLITTYPL